MKDAACTCFRQGGELFDGDRLVPAGFDVFFNSAYLPGRNGARSFVEKMTVVVAVADKEPSHQSLFRFGQCDGGYICRLRAELPGQKFDGSAQALGCRMPEFGVNLEDYRLAR